MAATQCARRVTSRPSWRCSRSHDTARRVVPDNIDASNDSFKDKGADGKPTPATISVHRQRQEVGGLHDNIYHEVSGAMNNLLEQRLWKWKLLAGVLTIVLGAIVLPEQLRHHLSLMHGWIPMTVCCGAAVRSG